jgi:hypothetical protein
VRAIWGTPEKYFLHIYHKVSFRTSLCGEHVAGGTGNEMVVYKQARLLWLVTILYEQSQDGAEALETKHMCRYDPKHQFMVSTTAIIGSYLSTYFLGFQNQIAPAVHLGVG